MKLVVGHKPRHEVLRMQIEQVVPQGVRTNV